MFKNLCPAALGVSGGDSETIELALSYGFKGVDLDLAAFTEQVKLHGYDKASRRLVSSRLKFGSFPLPVQWQSDSPQFDDDLKRLPAFLDLAKQLGCHRAHTTIEPGSDTRPFHENFEFHRGRLTQIGEVLAKDDIRLAVGFLAPLECRSNLAFQFMQKTDEVLMLLGTVPVPNVGLALDTWHWHVGGGSLDHLRALSAEKIVTVTVSDVEPGFTAENVLLSARRLPGDGGMIDNAALLTALAEMRYDGPVTPAADQSRFTGQSRDQIVKAAAAALDVAWKAAGLNSAGRLAAVTGR